VIKCALIDEFAAGGINDERALYHALSQQIIAGAGVDVLKKEPFDANDPIFPITLRQCRWRNEETPCRLLR
jgi:lactate dehydrogenase-like 2-hydroxyacid dehydrogenase